MPKVSEKKRKEEVKKYMNFLQERKYELFQVIPGLIDAMLVEGPPSKILLKTVTEVALDAHPVIKNSGLVFEVKIMEAKDSQGKPIVITDAGLRNLEIDKKKEEDTDPNKKGLNDFIAVGVGENGQTVQHKVPGQKDVVDVKINPADMVFKPGDM